MAKRGLLLLNLGSPEAPTPEAVKIYLKQFLNDPYVIDIPKVLRIILVNGIIVPRRKFSSAEAYEKIWTKNGSPLVHTTKVFAEKVAASIGDRWDVRWAMRYGQPSVASVLKDWSPEDLHIVPLYPQYAESSTLTAIDEVKKHARVPFRYLQDFYIEPEFIDSEVRQIEAALKNFEPDRLLLSFHGLPQHHLTKIHPTICAQTPQCSQQISSGNRMCYRAQSFATARAISDKLSFPKQNVVVGFQSRLGNRPWIQPYTDVVVEDLAKAGVKRLLVACPSFVTDCLETLEEIQMRLKEQFLEAGGTDLQLVAAPNAEAHWVDNFTRMVQKTSMEWKVFQR